MINEFTARPTTNKSLGFILMGICLIFFNPLFLLATSLEINPKVLIVTLAPGESKKVAVEIKNHSDEKLDLMIEEELWSPKQLPVNNSSYLQIVQTKSFILTGQAQKTITMMAKMPPRAGAEVVVMVFLSEKQNKDEFTIKTRIGFPVYIKNNSSDKKQAEIAMFSGVQDKDNIIFNFTVINQGTSHILPFGALVLKHGGLIIDQKEIEYKEPIFPDASINQVVKMNNLNLKNSDYEAQLNLFFSDIYNEQLSNSPIPMLKKIVM